MHILSFIKYCQLLQVVILNYTSSNDVQKFSFLGGTESLFSIIISLFSSISPCTQDIFPDFTSFLHMQKKHYSILYAEKALQHSVI